MSYEKAAEFSAGFRRGTSKGTGLEGISSAIVGFLTEYSEFLEPLSNAIADLINGGEDAKKPESIKAAVERYVTLPNKADGTEAPMQEDGTILGGTR
jgi:hypothetical protein